MDSCRKYFHIYLEIGGDLNFMSFVSSDCEFAGEVNNQGLIWCEKKNLYVSGKEKETCEYYKKK